jgi:hypothetical protein
LLQGEGGEYYGGEAAYGEWDEAGTDPAGNDAYAYEETTGEAGAEAGETGGVCGPAGIGWPVRFSCNMFLSSGEQASHSCKAGRMATLSLFVTLGNKQREPDMYTTVLKTFCPPSMLFVELANGFHVCRGGL